MECERIARGQSGGLIRRARCGTDLSGGTGGRITGVRSCGLSVNAGRTKSCGCNTALTREAYYEEPTKKSPSREPSERGVSLPMSIDNELSSEVAAALLAPDEGKSPRDASRLAEVVKDVHSTLRQLEAESRRKNRRPASTRDEPPTGSAASG